MLFAEMVEHSELASDLVDPAPSVPDNQTQERVWAFLERDLQQLSLALGKRLDLR